MLHDAWLSSLRRCRTSWAISWKILDANVWSESSTEIENEKQKDQWQRAKEKETLSPHAFVSASSGWLDSSCPTAGWCQHYVLMPQCLSQSTGCFCLSICFLSCWYIPGFIPFNTGICIYTVLLFHNYDNQPNSQKLNIFAT